jgi:hypothetical protein
MPQSTGYERYPFQAAKPQFSEQDNGCRFNQVEVLVTYSHSTQAPDLRLCHTVALTSPVRCPETERERP